MKYIVAKAEQGTQEWLDERAGAITASMFTTARERLKNGKRSAPGLAYMAKLAIERLKGSAVDVDTYETYAMRRGKELEHDARLLHEQYAGVFIEQGALILSEDLMFGYSTDGFIGDDGLAEYKCFTQASKVMDVIFESNADNVMDQIQGGMWITGRQWCDYVFYYPDLECIGLNLVVTRIERDDAYIEELVADLLAFNAEVDALATRLVRRAAEVREQRLKVAIRANLVEREFVSDGVKVIPEAAPDTDLDDIF